MRGTLRAHDRRTGRYPLSVRSSSVEGRPHKILPIGQSENGQASADALVKRGCPPLVAGSVRRSRPAAGQSLPRVAPEIPEPSGSTATGGVPPNVDTVPS